MNLMMKYIKKLLLIVIAFLVFSLGLYFLHIDILMISFIDLVIGVFCVVCGYDVIHTALWGGE